MSRKSPFAVQKAVIDSSLVVCPHKSLNFCRDISETNLLCASEAEILEGLFDQGSEDQIDDIIIFGKNSEYKPNITFYPDYLKLLKTNYNSNRVEFLDLDLHLVSNIVVRALLVFRESDSRYMHYERYHVFENDGMQDHNTLCLLKTAEDDIDFEDSKRNDDL
ncbi:hypothetical protein TNCV_1525861 [Trichonephila clavipes]|nr:hypothetical protein TNCV_1525861 [Trichonephila clavipes]